MAKWKNRGVARKVVVRGQKIPVRVERPRLDITKETGTRLRLEEQEGGTSRLIVSAEGQGRAPGPVPRRNLEQLDLDRAREQIAELLAQKQNLINGWISGGEAHQRFTQGLKSSRPGLWGTLFPSGILQFWDVHPFSATSAALKRARFSKVGKSRAGFRTARSDSKSIFTSRKREAGISGALGESRTRASQELAQTLNAYSTAVNAALEGLQASPTQEQFHQFQRAVEAAEAGFKRELYGDRGGAQGILNRYDAVLKGTKHWKSR